MTHRQTYAHMHIHTHTLYLVSLLAAAYYNMLLSLLLQWLFSLALKFYRFRILRLRFGFVVFVFVHEPHGMYTYIWFYLLHRFDLDDEKILHRFVFFFPNLLVYLDDEKITKYWNRILCFLQTHPSLCCCCCRYFNCVLWWYVCPYVNVCCFVFRFFLPFVDI